MGVLVSGSVLVGRATGHVAGGLIYDDFGILSPLATIESDLEEFETAFRARFQDGRTLYPNEPRPIGVEITQRSYSASSGPNSGFVLLRYDVTNEREQTLSNLHVGLALKWERQEVQLTRWVR